MSPSKYARKRASNTLNLQKTTQLSQQVHTHTHVFSEFTIIFNKQDLKRYAEAEKLFEEVLTTKLKVTANSKDKVLCVTYNNIAIVLEKQQKWQSSIGNFKKCIELTSLHLGTIHPTLANLHEKVATLFLRLPAKSDEALSHFNQALSLYIISNNNEAVNRIKQSLHTIPR